MAPVPRPRATHPPLRLDSIRRDRSRGATDLGYALLRELREWAVTATLEGPRGARELQRASGVVRRAQPAMGLFRQWAAMLSNVGALPRGRRRALATRLRADLRRLRGESGRVSRAAAMVLPPGATFVTISRSRTVAGALLRAPESRRAARVFVLESRPGGEGRDQARDLRDGGVRATVVPDSRGPVIVREVDAVLIGADAVFEDGTVWHKVGTRRLVDAARARGVPVVVLAGTSKFVQGPAPRRVASALFDATAGRQVSLLVTERGPVPARRKDPRVGRR